MSELAHQTRLQSAAGSLISYHCPNDVGGAIGYVCLMLLAIAVESWLGRAFSAIFTAHCVARAALARKHGLAWHGSVCGIELRARAVAKSLYINGLAQQIIIREHIG